MKYTASLIALPLIVTLAACSEESDYDFETSQAERDTAVAAATAPEALFSPDPSAPVLPFPNSLYFQNSTDGTLNIPLGEDDDQTLANPTVALNQLDGFSTSSPISTAVSEELDPESLIVGDTIRVFEVNTTQAIAVTGVNAEVSDPLIVARSIGDQLVLMPTTPLKPATDYLVVLTDGIQDLSGDAMTASLVYNLLKGSDELSPALQGLQAATASHLAVANAAAGIAPENIVLSWVFRTQSTREALQAAKDQSNAAPLVLANAGATTPPSGKADIYIGTLDVPYYLTAVGEDGNPATATDSFWKNSSGAVVGTLNESGVPDHTPVATATETIPVIMTVPNANSAVQGVMPEGGWPVTIFQHGITGNRTQMLGIAEALADAGRVAIGIDMPLHGLIDTTSPFHADNTPFAEHERTFGIDQQINPLEDGETADPDAPLAGPDGKADTSGTYFINLQNLANSRDNLRQTTADLFVLRASLAGAIGEGFGNLNANNVSFLGHSLGAMTGATMLSYDDSFLSATLAMPGGGIAQLLANSPRFSPGLNIGLAGAGIATGSDDYNTFLLVAQTLLDSGDPINHAAIVAQRGTPPIHLIEVIGDEVIPNAVSTAPLSGTEPLARQLNLSQVDATSNTGGLVVFTAGDHGSILSPDASLEATIEMQIQTATFAASAGTVLPITDSSVIATVPE